MQDISLSFFIAVNTDKETIIKILKKQKDILFFLFDQDQIKVGRNNVEIKRNEDYDEKLSLTDEDAFLYYESNMYFYSYDDTLRLKEQIQLAKVIRKTFMESGISAEIAAEFENLLETVYTGGQKD